MSQDKAAIRRALLTRRRALTSDETRARGKAIEERLETLPEYAAAETVFIYVSSKDNEVGTHGLIEGALARGRPVAVPIAESRGRLLWSRLDAFDELAAGRFGILEPLPEFRRTVLPNASDIVVVPGIGFTPEGNRIGYGGGYFDRFLAGFTGVSAALAYSMQIVPSVPEEPHDVPVDIVVTESDVFRRRARAQDS
jgi:5-formyltetrahydrofolate cyclo-ligase